MNHKVEKTKIFEALNNGRLLLIIFYVVVHC